MVVSDLSATAGAPIRRSGREEAAGNSPSRPKPPYPDRGRSFVACDDPDGCGSERIAG